MRVGDTHIVLALEVLEATQLGQVLSNALAAEGQRKEPNGFYEELLRSIMVRLDADLCGWLNEPEGTYLKVWFRDVEGAR